jgi:nitronate monooxygenase
MDDFPRTQAMQLFGIELPVVQGPFGGGLSSPALAAGVANRGGLGSYGAHALAPDQIGTVARQIRGLARGPFALNLWIPKHDANAEADEAAAFERAWRHFAPWFRELGVARPERPARYLPPYEAQVEALLEARPAVFSFVFGIPSTEVLAACRARGIVTLGAATSIAEAQALEAAGVDAIVATGFEAGGHRPSFLAPAEESLMGTFALVQLVAPRVRIPVVAAGGIVDARGIRAALTLGAQAAQLGTAFLACAESGTTDAHRAALFSPQAERTVLTRAYSGRLARGLRNGWTEAWATRRDEIAAYPLQGWFAAQLRPAALAAGRHDLVSLWSGQSAPNLEHRAVDALMQALRAGLFDAIPDPIPRESIRTPEGVTR